MSDDDKKTDSHLFARGDATVAAKEPTVEQLLSYQPKVTESKKFLENTVYTLNHALVCLSMDLFVAPWVGNFTQRYFDKRINIWHAHDHDDHDHGHGHGHDHGHDHHHGDHHHHDGDHHHGDSHHDHHHGNFWHWLIGEGAGDLGAVPLTVAMDYAAPGLMRGIQTVSEPVLGPAFRWSSERHANKWAYEHGFESQSPEAKARAKELYDFEVEHLPQAFMWTASSSVMNLAVQRLAGNTGYWRSMIAGKLNASLWPLITTLTIRSLAPNTAQRIDAFNTNYIAEPVTKRLSKLVGVDYESVKQAMDEEHEHEDGYYILEASRKLRGELPEKAQKKLDEAREAHAEEGKDTSRAEETSADRQQEDAPDKTIQAANANVAPPRPALKMIG